MPIYVLVLWLYNDDMNDIVVVIVVVVALVIVVIVGVGVALVIVVIVVVVVNDEHTIGPVIDKSDCDKK